MKNTRGTLSVVPEPGAVALSLLACEAYNGPGADTDTSSSGMTSATESHGSRGPCAAETINRHPAESCAAVEVNQQEPRRREVNERTGVGASDLDAQGRLARIHGGAIVRRSIAEVGLWDRERMHIQDKRAIAHACVDLINDGDAVFLDSGTTTSEIAKALALRSRPGSQSPLRQVKVLTTSFQVAEICSARPGDAAIVLGGAYRAGSTVGPLTLSALHQFRVDIAFIGVTGVTEEGFCAADPAEAEIKSAVINRATEAVVPIDHSKIGLSDFARICSLEQVQTVVTNRAVPSLVEWLSETSVELLLTTRREGAGDRVPRNPRGS